MMFTSALCVFLVSVIAVGSADYTSGYDNNTPRYETCSSTITKCLKEAAGGSYTGNWWGYKAEGYLKTVYHSVWASCELAKEYNTTCFSTQRTPKGGKDSYYNNCKLTKDISYDSKMDSGIIHTTNYEGHSMKCYPYLGEKNCWGHYCCTDTGLVRPTFKIMCKTKSAKENKADIEKGLKILKMCKSDKGVPMCADKC